VFHIANGNQALFSNSGTVGAPSISFDNDQNTGIINPSNADNLGFVTNGSERMRIDQVGAVGIGTASPFTGCKLDVNGSVRVANGSQLFVSATSAANAPAITFFNNANTGIFSPGNNTVAITTGAQERLRVDPNGRISIGTTTAPTNGLLMVNGGAAIGYGSSQTIPQNGLIVNGTVGIGTANPNASNKLSVSGGGIWVERNLTGNWQNLLSTTSSSGSLFGLRYNDEMQELNLIADNQICLRSAGPDLVTEGSLSVLNGASINNGLTVGSGDVVISNGKLQVKNWTVEAPDYVFNKDYKLPSLKDVEKKITAEKHLPGVPSAAEMKKNGMDMAKMNMTLLKKVEELTLYVIEQNKKIESLEKRVAR
jgi:hypothetical protein